jgi:hypothetical protein
MRGLFTFFGIVHDITPVKEWWLGLTLFSALFKLLLSLRRLPYLPGLACHLMAAAVSGVLQQSHLWGLWGEALYTITAILFVSEIIYISALGVARPLQRRYIRNTILSFALCCIGTIMFLDPSPYPTWPKLRYLIHLYTVLFGFAVATLCAAYHWSQRTKPHWLSYTLPAIPWFGSGLWAAAAISWHPERYYTIGIIGVVIQILCLAVWLADDLRVRPHLR